MSGTQNAEFTLLPLTPHDRAWVRQLSIENWAADFVVSRGRIHFVDTLPGWGARQGDERVGLVAYELAGRDCEVVSLNSLRPGLGIGTALLDAVADRARRTGCRRVWLITTNDNLHALGFYQRRGYRLVAVYPNALAETRRLKPALPEIGMNDIPLRDELELELKL